MTKSVQRIIICAVVAILLGLFVVLSGALVYMHNAAERAGNEAAAQQDLKTITAVEIRYYNMHNRTFGTFEDLRREQLLTSKFSGDRPTADGYVFTLNVAPKTEGQQNSYTLNVDPRSDRTGRNHFYIDSISRSIHVNADQPAAASDPSRVE